MSSDESPARLPYIQNKPICKIEALCVVRTYGSRNRGCVPPSCGRFVRDACRDPRVTMILYKYYAVGTRWKSTRTTDGGATGGVSLTWRIVLVVQI